MGLVRKMVPVMYAAFVGAVVSSEWRVHRGADSPLNVAVAPTMLYGAARDSARKECTDGLDTLIALYRENSPVVDDSLAGATELRYLDELRASAAAARTCIRKISPHDTDRWDAARQHETAHKRNIFDIGFASFALALYALSFEGKKEER